jgi:hypothetical protein
MTSHEQVDDFDVGKSVFEKLKDLPPERQQRVLRWVAEGLGVSFSPTGAPPALTGPPAPPSLGSLTPPPPAGPGADIKSFIATKSPKSDTQFAAAVAYFYRFEAPPAARRDSINGDALQEAARLAGRKRLGRPRVTLNNAKAAGYLDGTTPGEFAINSVGENLVAMALPGGAQARTGQARQPKTKKKTAKARRSSTKA